MNITESLQPLAVNIDSLTLDHANARKHGERNMQAIKDSLKRFGQRTPIVVQKEGMVVRAGNGRVQAARDLGWTEIAAVIVDESSVDAAAYALVDNRTAELAEWDLETLGAVIESFDADLRGDLGFTPGEIDNLLGADWDPNVENVDIDLEDHKRVEKDDKSDGSTIFLTAEQFSTLNSSLHRLRDATGDPKLTLGDALVRFADTYFLGAE